MHLPFLAILLEFSRTAVSMEAAGIVLFVIGAFAATRAVADSRGLEKVVALSNLLFAMPLAAFGGEHFAAANGISQIVPSFVPWHLFITYFVGVALVAASLSIATNILVQWSGLLFGIMMFLFVAMMDLPGTIHEPHNRIIWTLLFREMSFGCGGFCLAALAMEGGRAQSKSKLVTVARVIIGLAALLYGVEHFLHPTNVPGVPLEKFMPTWIPAPATIAYVTGAILLVCGIGILLAKKTRLLATYLGTWIALLVVFIYGPILVSSLLDPSTDTKVEGLNYFFDTMLFAGTILALAGASPQSE